MSASIHIPNNKFRMQDWDRKSTSLNIVLFSQVKTAGLDRQ